VWWRDVGKGGVRGVYCCSSAGLSSSVGEEVETAPVTDSTTDETAATTEFTEAKAVSRIGWAREALGETVRGAGRGVTS
jgi:hypothetical protein